MRGFGVWRFHLYSAAMFLHCSSGCMLMLFLLCIPLLANEPDKAAAKPARHMQQIVDDAAQSALRQFAAKGLKAENLAITLIDLSDAAHPSANFNGDKPIYPASV